MNMNEFLSFRPRCIVCGVKNRLWMSGTIRESIGEATIHSLYSFRYAIIRKHFITFAINEFVMLPSHPYLDIKTLNQNKYSSFTLSRDDIVSFDKDFEFKMRLSFTMICPEAHYSYTSRMIKISNKSLDITKGYEVMSEDLKCEQYRIMSNKKGNETLIFNYESPEPASPIVIPYKEITSFPYDDTEKCVKKIENILLLV